MKNETSRPATTTDRRRFLISTASSLAVATSVARNETRAAMTREILHQDPSESLESSQERSPSPVCVFTKPLQELEFAQLAELLSKWPVEGVEATVRAGGQIEPARAAEQLPRLHECLVAKQRSFMILASDVQSAEHPDVPRVLEVASKLGIRYFRMGYYQYQKDQPVLPQLDRFAKQAQGLAQVCKQLGMTGLYQNHAGSDYVGAPVWDLLRLLDGISSDHLAVALDIRHTTVESTTAWPLAYSAIRPHVGAIFVKDAIVEGNQVRDVALGEGRNAKTLFQRIHADGIPGPISLHMEHMDHRDPQLLSQRIEATARDISTLREWLADR